MFIGTAVVGLCIGLLIHYGTCTGIVFSSVVVGFAYCYFRRDKTGMILYVVVYVAFWIALQFIGPYTSLRNRVVWVIGIERLQQWAIEMLDDPPPADEHGRIRLDGDKLPKDIQTVAGPTPTVVLARNGTEAYISFFHGSGFYGWGLEVGCPGFMPPPRSSFKYEKLADGVWGFYER
jgi:hypothetical protein